MIGHGAEIRCRNQPANRHLAGRIRFPISAASAVPSAGSAAGALGLSTGLDSANFCTGVVDNMGTGLVIFSTRMGVALGLGYRLLTLRSFSCFPGGCRLCCFRWRRQWRACRRFNRQGLFYSNKPVLAWWWCVARRDSGDGNRARRCRLMLTQLRISRPFRPRAQEKFLSDNESLSLHCWTLDGGAISKSGRPARSR